jgi:DNA-binding IclR family transcriptional regulator
MIPKEKSTAPALDNGLDILEQVIRSENGTGFNQLAEELPVTRATVSRLLKVLIKRGYLSKDSQNGKYFPGNRLSLLGLKTPLLEKLLREAQPVIKSLSEKAMNNTVILIYWTGREMQVLSRFQQESSVAMMPAGTIRTDLSLFPWGWLFYEELSKTEKAEAEAKIELLEEFKKLQASRLEDYKQNSYLYDDCGVFEHVRRFTSLLKDRNGQIIGALGVGGSPLSIPNEKVEEIGKQTAIHAKILSEKI